MLSDVTPYLCNLCKFLYFSAKGAGLFKYTKYKAQRIVIYCCVLGYSILLFSLQLAIQLQQEEERQQQQQQRRPQQVRQSPTRSSNTASQAQVQQRNGQQRTESSVSQLV